MTGDLANAVAAVVQHFPPAGKNPHLIPLGNRGGFSGARLWRFECSQGPFCLKAWPPAGPSQQRLIGIHELMYFAREKGLRFVPALARSQEGSTCIEQEGRLWDLTTWMPGDADFHAAPTPDRLVAACAALAQLHGVWAQIPPRTPSGSCPGVRRRLERVRDWQALVGSGWRPVFEETPDQAVRSWAQRAWDCLGRAMGRLPNLLAPWVNRPLPLQPCLCDIWHDHVLFQGDAVTGLIDYGAVKRDHIAVDLARLLGSLVGDDQHLRRAGLGAYARICPLSAAEESLIDVLDESGILIGLANWLEWLYWDKRVFEDPQAVTRRLGEMVRRVEARYNADGRGPSP
jgi:homoserine kinase type II